MLIDNYGVIGDKQKAIDCINEILNVHSLDKFKRYYYIGLKAYYLGNYEQLFCGLEKF